MVTKINNPVLDLTSPGVNGALFSADVNMGGNRVTNVPLVPAANADAASKNYVDQVAATAGGGVFLPAGFGPVPWASNSVVPVGWLICDGQQYDPALFPDLSAALGTTYNTGGETPGWFRVPDMRGIAPAGMDDMTPFGSTQGPAGRVLDPSADTQGGLHPAGAETHTLTIGEMPSHDHGGGGSGSTGSAGSHTHTFANPSPIILQSGGGSTTSGGGQQQGTPVLNAAGAHTHSVSITVTSEGSDQAHNNMQPTRFFIWIIKSDDSTVGFPGGINMGGNGIFNMADPVADQDAATKVYVDVRSTYDVSMFRSGLQSSANKEIARVPAVRNFTIPANFVGSRCEGRISSSGVSTFDIRKNGALIGTITVSAASTTGVFVDTAAGPHTFTSSDILTIDENTTDSTYEDVGIVLEGLLT